MRISDWSSDVCSSDLEHRILAAVEAGRDAVAPLLGSNEAGARVKAVAAINHGLELNGGQEAAARLILRSSHRTIAIQGFAGADRKSVVSGKSVSGRVDLGGRRIIKKKKNEAVTM